MALRQRRFSWSWLRGLVLGTGLAQGVLIGSAHAEEDSAAETAAARSLAVDGLKLAQAGKCEEAIPKLERAEKLHHSAIVLSHLGECQVGVGKLVEGTEMLRKVLREPLPANPSASLSKAYERAQLVLDSAKPKIAGLTISVSAPPGAELHLSVDGSAVASSLVDSELPADPGEHVIEASAPGFLKASARINLSAADKKAVSLSLQVDPNAPAPAARSSNAEDARPVVAPTSAATPSTTHPASLPNQSRASNHAAAYVSWGVGLVGVGVGSVFGLMALKDKREMNGKCGTSCPASERDALDSAKRSGTVSTVAFGVGGAGLLLGTVLYFSMGNGSPAAEAKAPARGFAGLKNGRAWVGPGSIQLAADF